MTKQNLENKGLKLNYARRVYLINLEKLEDQRNDINLKIEKLKAEYLKEYSRIMEGE